MMRNALLIVGALLLMLWSAQFSVFGDELDNLVGGKLIAQGGVLYQDYWSHHMPLAYDIAAVLYHLGARTTLHFRWIWCVLLWLTGLALWSALRHPLVLWTMLALALLSIPLRSTMILAETIVGYAALMAWAALMSRRSAMVILILLLCWIMVAVSLKAVYLAMALAGLSLWQARREWRVSLIAFVLPLALTLLYALRLPLHAFFDQAYTFNRVIYSLYATQPDAVIPRTPLETLINMLLSYISALRTLTPDSAFAGMALSAIITAVVQGLCERWLHLLSIVALIVFSYPVSELNYNAGPHFITHYIILTGVCVYALFKLVSYRSHRRADGRPAASSSYAA